MSFDSQILRVSQGTKDTLKALINKLGGSISDELIDQYPSLVNNMTLNGNVFYATYGTTSGADILSAVSSGHAVYCKYSDRIYPLVSTANNIYTFLLISTDDGSLTALICSGSTWTVSTISNVPSHASEHSSSGSDPITPDSIGASATGHKHAASDITSGTVSSSRLPTVPLTKGGTGAKTADAARSNLDAAPSYVYSQTDITAGTTELGTGRLYFVYE